ncbi:N-acetylglucosaminyl-phosphatidylinositol de-N-acetylase [Termitomyces sp. J132]|nr:N-acetylglucosaminyl-phosphatidylinositol de-N-acetylase [Termitomyces sp. J132]
MANHIACIALLIALLVALLAKPLEAPLQHTGNVLLLTAHPDDECMFFAPTIRALVRAQTPVFSLCLSVGNADGLGSIRRDELAHSLEVLNIPAHRRWAVDHPDLQDNFTARWDPVTIASVLQPYVKSNNIETILTFDAGGISGHPNHCSLPDGVAHLPAPPRLYTLVTRPLHAKYIGVLAPLLASSPQPVIVSGIYDYLTALQAMRAHTSQLVWFRWLYVLFSRYMWINEWAESRPTPLR